jgi:glycogen operon protein
MLLGGDEMGRTQQGNNNAYCQDNEISWFDWSGLLADGETSAKSLLRTTTRMIALRKQHPSLRAEKFLHGNTEILPGVSDTAWFDERGSELKPDCWANETAQMLSLRRAVVSGGNVDVTYLALNASHEDREFIVPNPEMSWKIELDTATPDQEPEIVNAAAIKVAAHSAVLLTATVSI